MILRMIPKGHGIWKGWVTTHTEMSPARRGAGKRLYCVVPCPYGCGIDLYVCAETFSRTLSTSARDHLAGGHCRAYRDFGGTPIPTRKELMATIKPILTTAASQSNW